MNPTFNEMHSLLVKEGPANICSSKGTKYLVSASRLSKGARKGEKVITARPKSGAIYIHEDCWTLDVTCQASRASSIYHGSPSIYDWYNDTIKQSSVASNPEACPKGKISINWKVDDDFAKRIKQLCQAAIHNPFVRIRKKRNLDNPPTHVTKEEAWYGMIACLVTTQQRSGPNSPAARFLNLKPFPLSYGNCSSSDSSSETIQEILSECGLRRSRTISEELEHNLGVLEKGEWGNLIDYLHCLVGNDDPEVERKIANYIQNKFKGFGPKQSRNLLQSLGLSKYEIPIDSRIVKWLTTTGFPVTLSSTALSDEGYYRFISEGIQTICARSGVYPCILDAVIFSSLDGNGWTDDNVIW